MRFNYLLLGIICSMLAACGTKPIAPSDKHLQRSDTESARNAQVPQTIKRVIPLAPPQPAAKIETYSVVVANVPAQEILFALARDAKINLDIQSGIQGTVTVNAINQTLPQILTRIARQVDMRYELDNGTLTVMPDKPFLRTYKIDFINMDRSAKSTNSTSSQIASTSTSAKSEGSAATGAGGGNSASTTVTSETKNNLMESLVQNVKDIILDEDKLHYQEQVDLQTQQQIQARGTGTASGSSSLASQTKNNGIEINQAANGGNVNSGSRTGGSVLGVGDQDVQGQGEAVAKKGVYERAVNVFANKETGVLIVRASSRQHEKIQEFIDMVMSAAKRQVLIEATIVEVQLSDQYKQGIDWSRALLGTKGFELSQTGTAGIATSTGALAVSYINPTSKFGNIAASVQLLEKFGNVKVLSSPKLTVMNNQTASLKVADSKVYFTVKADILPATLSSPASASYSTTANSVSVGLTMSVTPQISGSDTVTINVRPSISSLIGLGAKDPNPVLANPCGFGVTGCTIPAIENRIPEIQTREMESIIKIENGQTAVMGGLIKEEINLNTSEIPLLGRIPLLGNLFQNRDDTTTKTELVIFLRPVVIKDASINGDFSEFRDTLPGQDFFKESAKGKP